MTSMDIATSPGTRSGGQSPELPVADRHDLIRVQGARVNNLKEAGAKEVHVLVSCPPHMNPCVYGIDFPDRSKLMAANHSLDEIRKYLNADSLAYLSQAGMVKATGLPAGAFCMACYDGNYPVPFDPLMDKHIIERRRARVESLGEALVKEDLQPRLL